MHDSSLPESADVTPSHPSVRPRLRPLIGVPEGALKENRRRGAIIAVLSHVMIVILLLLPAFFHREITDALTDGAGGAGAAGGGGGGRGGAPVVPERIQLYRNMPPPSAKATPSVLPPITPVPPEVKKPVETPKVEPTPAAAPTATNAPPVAVPAAPAPGAGAGAGAGTDNGPGNGPGTGGGNGSGVGTGTGSSIGSGTGGGNATIFPAQPRAMIVPPNPVPRRLKGKTITIELDVDESGKVVAAEFSPRSGDSGYDERFLSDLREQKFRPAVRPNGQPVSSKFRYEISL